MDAKELNRFRVKRYRAHQKDDHQYCSYPKCAQAPDAPVSPVTSVTGAEPLGLESRGQTLWDALHAGPPLSPAHEQLALEACRTADRLERLDDMLRGRRGEWMTLLIRAGEVYEIDVTDVLKEARQQQAIFRTMIAELRQAGAPGNAGVGGVTFQPEPVQSRPADAQARGGVSVGNVTPIQAITARRLAAGRPGA